MDNLTEIVETAMRGYAGEGLNGNSYFTISDDKTLMSVVFVGEIRGKPFTDVSILARIVGQRVIIERDVTNKPLVDALMQAGVPREQIVLAYAGEMPEEPA